MGMTKVIDRKKSIAKKTENSDRHVIIDENY